MAYKNPNDQSNDSNKKIGLAGLAATLLLVLVGIGAVLIGYHPPTPCPTCTARTPTPTIAYVATATPTLITVATEVPTAPLPIPSAVPSAVSTVPMPLPTAHETAPMPVPTAQGTAPMPLPTGVATAPGSIAAEASATLHLLYSEFGADMVGSDVEYDAASQTLVYAVLRLHWPLNNHSELLVFVHHRGEPPKLTPDYTIVNLYKGEGAAITKEGTGLRWEVNGHSTNPADRHPDGSRLTTLETDVIPGIFPN